MDLADESVQQSAAERHRTRPQPYKSPKPQAELLLRRAFVTSNSCYGCMTDRKSESN
ncbi:hypothetical protein CIHG_04592 [Coccidioides immitis H538.4]|uniref:Uncharacterized protein n=3 Tax=Coccidioides immitis TaxID=5501 RepID=A0A0J8R1B4_COCIT|nr:hypothetical protein CIRG_06758 [Coccidioides immitis RMSCC 2394]KMU78954.1 hypothetical protein CISG_07597 [Coccidioides immitis RMSCC 3703]KMU86803.1 hypothetical protein CIHG_04592 [Coccidioides immitis H538.4]